MRKKCVICGYLYDEDTPFQIPPSERYEEDDLSEEERLIAEQQEGVCPSCALLE